MNPELIAAIKERLALGHTPEMIREELKQTGYDETSIEVALTTAQAGAATVELPSTQELLSAGWQFARRYLDLSAILVIPFLLLTLAEYLRVSEVVMGAGILLALLLYALLITAAVRLVMVDTGTGKVPIMSLLPWVKEHFVGLAWVSVLSTLVVMGGLLLFIVPAIIISLSVYVAQFAYVQEGARGMQALLRSRELIQGQWWAVFGRLLGVLSVFLAVLLGSGMVVGATALVVSGQVTVEGGVFMLLFDLLGQVLSALMTLVGLKVGFTIYERLRAAKPETTAVSPARGRYLALAWLGVLSIFIFGSQLWTAAPANDWRVASTVEEEITAEEAKQRALELREQVN